MILNPRRNRPLLHAHAELAHPYLYDTLYLCMNTMYLLCISLQSRYGQIQSQIQSLVY